MTMDKKIRDYMLEKREQKPQIANWCCVCNEPILVGDTYLPVSDFGWVCEYCAKVRVVAE